MCCFSKAKACIQPTPSRYIYTCLLTVIKFCRDVTNEGLKWRRKFWARGRTRPLLWENVVVISFNTGCAFIQDACLDNGQEIGDYLNVLILRKVHSFITANNNAPYMLCASLPWKLCSGPKVSVFRFQNDSEQKTRWKPRNPMEITQFRACFESLPLCLCVTLLGMNYKYVSSFV